MPFLKFTLLRFGLAGLIYLLCLFLGIGQIFSAFFGLIASWALTYLFCSRMRREAVDYLARRYNPSSPHRLKTEKEDADAEDALRP